MADAGMKYITGLALTTAAPFLPMCDDDYLVRVTPTQSVVRSTSDVHAHLTQWTSKVLADVVQLRQVVRWQHQVIDYNSIYQAFLMEQLTDDEFESEAEKFAYDPRAIDVDQLAASVERIYSLTGIAYTPSDISSLFQCDYEAAVGAIELIQNTHPELSFLAPGDAE